MWDVAMVARTDFFLLLDLNTMYHVQGKDDLIGVKGSGY